MLLLQVLLLLQGMLCFWRLKHFPMVVVARSSSFFDVLLLFCFLNDGADYVIEWFLEKFKSCQKRTLRLLLKDF